MFSALFSQWSAFSGCPPGKHPLHLPGGAPKTPHETFLVFFPLAKVLFTKFSYLSATIISPINGHSSPSQPTIKQHREPCCGTAMTTRPKPSAIFNSSLFLLSAILDASWFAEADNRTSLPKTTHFWPDGRFRGGLLISSAPPLFGWNNSNQWKGYAKHRLFFNFWLHHSCSLQFGFLKCLD